jgi:hypothetical protein
MHSLIARLVTLGRDDDGMATAEYAVATVAACGFGSVLYRLLTSEAVGGLLRDLITRAITSVFG